MVNMRIAAAQYRVGESFPCVKRNTINVQGDLGAPCGETIVIHKYHWCAQVCPKCLANYFVGFGSDYGLYLDDAGWYPADTAARVRANIAANGGQYIPTFR